MEQRAALFGSSKTMGRGTSNPRTTSRQAISAGPRRWPPAVWKGTGGATADFDGDAAPDLALVNGEESPPSVFLNLGDGTFSLAQNIPSISTPDSLAPMDLNQDGRIDLVVGSQALSRLQPWLNLGVGGFEASGIIDLPVDPFPRRTLVGPLSLLPIDVDNDADVDLV